MPTALVLLERDGDVATLTFNQPERLNGMTRALKRDLSEALRQAQFDDAVRVDHATERCHQGRLVA